MRYVLCVLYVLYVGLMYRMYLTVLHVLHVSYVLNVSQKAILAREDAKDILYRSNVFTWLIS
jgi:hypothetical protein